MIWYIAILALGILIGLLTKFGGWIKLGIVILCLILYSLIIPSCFLALALMPIGLLIDAMQSIGRGEFVEDSQSVTLSIFKVPGRIIAGMEILGDML